MEVALDPDRVKCVREQWFYLVYVSDRPFTLPRVETLDLPIFGLHSKEYLATEATERTYRIF